MQLERGKEKGGHMVNSDFKESDDGGGREPAGAVLIAQRTNTKQIYILF